MIKLTTQSTKDGRRVMNDFEATTRVLAEKMADRHHGRREWEIFTIKRVVRNAAQSSDVATIYKNCVL